MLIIWLSVSTNHRKWLSTRSKGGGGTAISFYSNQKRRISMKYICETCGAVYDENAGDPARKIPPRTKFDQLPPSYACPYCGCEKDTFFPAVRRTPPVGGRNEAFWNNTKYSDIAPESDR